MTNNGGNDVSSERSEQYSITTKYDTQSPTVAIIDAIAALENEPPGELDLCLYEIINTDALNQLFDKRWREGHSAQRLVTTFDIGDYRIRLSNDETITITRLE